MSDQFYIISFKNSRLQEPFRFWRSSDAGYALSIEEAGLYSPADIIQHPTYYNGGSETIAVPKAVIDDLAAAPDADWVRQSNLAFGYENQRLLGWNKKTENKLALASIHATIALQAEVPTSVAAQPEQAKVFQGIEHLLAAAPKMPVGVQRKLWKLREDIINVCEIADTDQLSSVLGKSLSYLTQCREKYAPARPVKNGPANVGFMMEWAKMSDVSAEVKRNTAGDLIELSDAAFSLCASFHDLTVDAKEIAQETIDYMVHDLADELDRSDGSNINNGGVEAQITFLLAYNGMGGVPRISAAIEAARYPDNAVTPQTYLERPPLEFKFGDDSATLHWKDFESSILGQTLDTVSDEFLAAVMDGSDDLAPKIYDDFTKLCEHFVKVQAALLTRDDNVEKRAAFAEFSKLVFGEQPLDPGEDHPDIYRDQEVLSNWCRNMARFSHTALPARAPGY
ncbi:hypothetical protein ACFOY8_15045 [Thalassospira xianhensis]|uniref:hypothetical protein n=1 Tax=Thalassospira xianhensis TaxID=478503 RepID=UPI000DEDB158|nr:hypothetical protein [Thalassospira xianhensis]